jgi:hypothetical protein
MAMSKFTEKSLKQSLLFRPLRDAGVTPELFEVLLPECGYDLYGTYPLSQWANEIVPAVIDQWNKRKEKMQ